jgi:hypothetical protein
MREHSFYEQLILEQAFFVDDKKLSDALVEFFLKSKKSNLNLISKKKSIFYLVETLLDKPFKKAFLVSNKLHANSAYTNVAVLPSSMRELPPSYSFDENPFSTEFQKSLFILECWRKYLADIERSIEYSYQSSMFRILEFLAIYLIEFKPKSTDLTLGGMASETRSTTSSEKEMVQYCELCCRETLLFKLHVEQERAKINLTPHQLGPSSRFCSLHEPEVGHNWLYEKNQKHKKDVEIELHSLLNPGKSAFLPNFEWFIKYIPGLTPLEQKGIAIKLLHSKLNTPKKKEVRYDILKLLAQETPKSEIASITKLDIRSVDRNIEKIISEITKILKFPFLCSSGEQLLISSFDGSPFRGQPYGGHLISRRHYDARSFIENNKIYDSLGSAYKARGLKIVEISYPFPAKPNLKAILEAVNESLKVKMTI